MCVVWLCVVQTWTVTFWPASPGALQIENSEESDQGKYECVAVNSAGTRYSAPANLYVRGKIPLDPNKPSLQPLRSLSPTARSSLITSSPSWLLIRMLVPSVQLQRVRPVEACPVSAYTVSLSSSLSPLCCLSGDLCILLQCPVVSLLGLPNLTVMGGIWGWECFGLSGVKARSCFLGR